MDAAAEFRPDSSFHRLMGINTFAPLNDLCNNTRNSGPFFHTDNTDNVVVNLNCRTEPNDLDKFDVRKNAARIIYNTYIAYKNKKLFKELKFIVEKTEKALTPDLLKRLSPREAELLLDPVMKVTVRFRFGGEAFPPSIYYKILTSSTKTVTITGETAIPPGSVASFDACKQMGNRTYIENMLESEKIKACFRVHEAYQIVTKADIARYASFKDEMPSYLGGSGNGWRSLNALPLLAQQSLWRLIVKQAYANHGSSEKLVQKLYRYVRTQHNMFNAHMKAKLRPPPLPTPTPGMLKLRKWQKLFREQNETQDSDSELEDTGDVAFHSLYKWANNLSEEFLAKHNDLLLDK